MAKVHWIRLKYLKISILVVLVLFVFITIINLSKLPSNLNVGSFESSRIQLIDRNGKVLSTVYDESLNLEDNLKLYEIPEFFKSAFIISEDKRFYSHYGVDVLAKINSVYKAVRGSDVRGASTVTEQVVRILKPRKRNLFSKWLEFIDALRLDAKFSKDEIFEFYLNQVPYASNRRGVKQAANYYFGRSVDSLSEEEMIALVVLIRAPSKYNLYKGYHKSYLKSIKILANKMGKDIEKVDLQIYEREESVDTFHFNDFVKANLQTLGINNGKIKTTIDINIQKDVGDLLYNHLQNLSKYEVNNGAVLVIDRASGEILAWVNDNYPETASFDKVLVKRQPGSLLKPFAYAKAFEKGWNGATLIDDEPMITKTASSGVHNFKNYSERFYGMVSARQALGNSLNIPAIKTAEFVGMEEFLSFLHEVGLTSLDQDAEFYGDGLVLGNGEVSLYEIVRAYMVLANHGNYSDLKYLKDSVVDGRKVITPEIADIISDILSDSKARELEFGGRGALMDFPVQTAIKTGTSSAHRNAWSVGYNSKYVVGIWLGNLDYSKTTSLTGANSTISLLRNIFAKLNKEIDIKPLEVHKNVSSQKVCSDKECLGLKKELFVGGQNVKQSVVLVAQKEMKLIMPTEGMNVAIDPRVPKNLQKIKFYIDAKPENYKVEWKLNDKIIYQGNDSDFFWAIEKGSFLLETVIYDGSKIVLKQKTNFSVK